MTTLNADRSAVSDSYSGVRFFMPIDSLEEVRGALGDHLAEVWESRGGQRLRSLGQQPCPCRTHIETIVKDHEPGFYVWHGCAGLFLPLHDLELGAGEIRDHARDDRLLSAICNWLVELHDSRATPVYD